MASGCGDVLSLEDLKTAKMHQVFEAEVITGHAGGVISGAEIDYATNMATGQVQKTLPAVLRDAGYTIAGFDFSTGGTLSATDRNKAVLWPLSAGGDGDYYYWQGTLPKTIPASSTPASTGGVGAGAWRPVGDLSLRGQLKAGYKDIKLSQPKSTNFWIDVHPNARIHGVNDRVFIGAAVDNDGKITSTAGPTTKDWMELIRPATTNNAQFAVLSTIGQGAILGASRTSDFASAGSLGCIGGSFYGINNNTAYPQTAYGAYLEAQRFAGAGRTHGFELDIVNFGSYVGMQPYDMFQDGLTVGGWFASGAEFSSTRASAAIAIINNGSSFDKGIVFHSTSLYGGDGVTGSGIAVEMAKGHIIRWMWGSGSFGAGISSSVSNAAATQNLFFTDVGMIFRNLNSKPMFQVGISDSYVNGVNVTPANTGAAPSIGTQGDDTNIDLGLSPKGTGLVKITNPQVTGTAGALQGYVQVKLGNTTYKIPYYAV